MKDSIRLLRFWLVYLGLLGCGSPSKTPYFPPGSTIEVSGTYLDSSGQPISDRKLSFQNLRKFAYVDETSVEVETFFRLLAYPFFGFYDLLFGIDPFKVDRSKYEQRPNYRFENARTDKDGKFVFKVKADQMLRDAAGGINIVVVNESDMNSLFGKFSFVVKSLNVKLGSVSFCDLGGIQLTEDSGLDTVTFSWSKPNDSVARFVLRFAAVNSGAALWTQVVDGNTTSLNLPRALFFNQPVRLAIESFYAFEEEKKVSCLSSPKEFTLNSPSLSLASGGLVSATGINFKINALTNGSFFDRPYFEAFESTGFTLDLGQEKLVAKLAFYNLQLQASGKMKISGSSDGVTFTAPVEFEEKRFQEVTFGSPQTLRYLKVEFSSRLKDLQEIALF